MAYRLQLGIVFGILFVFGVASWLGCIHFFDTRVPVITIDGIRDNAWYKGEINCRVSSSKSGTVLMWRDGEPIATAITSMHRGSEYQFVIPTQTLADGKHEIKIEFTDKRYHRNHTVNTKVFYVDNMPLQAAFVQSENAYRVLQGRVLHVQFQVNKPIAYAEISTLSQEYPCFPEIKNSLIYECLVPIPCEEMSNEHPFSISITDHVGNKLTLDQKFQIVLFPFKKQALHVSQEKVQEEKEKGQEQQILDRILAELTEKSPREKLWHGSFCMPIEAPRITCEFGTIRTTREKGRYIHRALDLAGIPRCVVWATQHGIIAHTGRYAISGNTVIIDHGWGLLTLFFHLDSIANIIVGDKISKGNPIGTMGQTGYATGYHLHWEMRVNNMPIDPLQWVKDGF